MAVPTAETTSESETRRVAVAPSRKLCQSPTILIHRYRAAPDQSGARVAMISLAGSVLA